jgi:hypothetical protein
VNLLDLIRRHHEVGRAGEESEQSEGSLTGQGDSSLVSLSSQPPAAVPTESERCLAWVFRYVRGRYLRLADVQSAACTAGFRRTDVEAALRHRDVIVYRSFPRRNAPEVERVRTVDNWPDDPPLAAR